MAVGDSMIYFLNIMLARLSLILAILLSVIYILRWALRLPQYSKVRWLQTTNKLLRRYHKEMGIILVFSGLGHGLLSSYPLWYANTGTFAWILSMLFGVNFMLRKRFKLIPWMVLHRWLTVLFLGLIATHIIATGGFATNVLAKSFGPKPILLSEEAVLFDAWEAQQTEVAGPFSETINPLMDTEVDEQVDTTDETHQTGEPIVPQTTFKNATLAGSSTTETTHSTTVPTTVGEVAITQAPQNTLNTEAMSTTTVPPTTTAPPTTQAPKPKSKYLDGTYYGEADAYKPGLKVAVTILNDRIHAIEVVSHQETQLFYDRSVPISISRMLERQSPNVDAISSCTATVDGLTLAVKRALLQALNQ
jgi:uncharacterized protein with FMN-binding domain